MCIRARRDKATQFTELPRYQLEMELPSASHTMWTWYATLNTNVQFFVRYLWHVILVFWISVVVFGLFLVVFLCNQKMHWKKDQIDGRSSSVTRWKCWFCANVYRAPYFDATKNGWKYPQVSLKISSGLTRTAVGRPTTWTWCAAFGSNVNLGGVCSLPLKDHCSRWHFKICELTNIL